MDFPTPEELRQRLLAHILAGIEKGLYPLLTGQVASVVIGVPSARERDAVKIILQDRGWQVQPAAREHEFTVSLPAYWKP